MHRIPLLLGTLLLLGCNQRGASDQPPTEKPASKPQPAPSAVTANASTSTGLPTAGGIRWNAPQRFIAQTPKSAMRAAEYRVEGQGEPDAILAVFFFGPGQGGDVQSNIDRWVGQFKAPNHPKGKSRADIDKRTIAGMTVTTVDVTGTYTDTMMGPHAPTSPDPLNDQRMLGAIVEGPQGPVFFKLTGPRNTVTLVETAFSALINSIHPAS